MDAKWTWITKRTQITKSPQSMKRIQNGQKPWKCNKKGHKKQREFYSILFQCNNILQIQIEFHFHRKQFSFSYCMWALSTRQIWKHLIHIWNVLWNWLYLCTWVISKLVTFDSLLQSFPGHAYISICSS